MKANELRIGNLVSYQGREFQIDGTIKDYLFLDADEIEYAVEQSDLEPIPLTEERLIKLGCKQIHDLIILELYNHLYIEFYSLKDGIYPIIRQVSECTKDYDDEQRIALEKLEYVHEFQNLVYCLTGKELEIK